MVMMMVKRMVGSLGSMKEETKADKMDWNVAAKLVALMVVLKVGKRVVVTVVEMAVCWDPKMAAWSVT